MLVLFLIDHQLGQFLPGPKPLQERAAGRLGPRDFERLLVGLPAGRAIVGRHRGRLARQFAHQREAAGKRLRSLRVEALHFPALDRGREEREGRAARLGENVGVLPVGQVEVAAAVAHRQAVQQGVICSRVGREDVQWRIQPGRLLAAEVGYPVGEEHVEIGLLRPGNRSDGPKLRAAVVLHLVQFGRRAPRLPPTEILDADRLAQRIAEQDQVNIDRHRLEIHRHRVKRKLRQERSKYPRRTAISRLWSPVREPEASQKTTTRFGADAVCSSFGWAG